MARDVVFVCLGGLAQGTFGAGVLSAWNKRRLSSRIFAIYGASAGALNAAVYVSGTIDQALRIYSRHVSYGRIIRPWRFIWSDVIDIDTLFPLVTAPINVRRIRHSPIDCKVLLMRTDNGQASYQSIRTLTNYRLKAAVAVPPYYWKEIMIGKHCYVDGAVADVINAQQIIAECRGKRIVLVSNEPLDRGAWQRCKDLFEYSIFLFTYPRIARRMPRKLSHYNKDIELLRKRGNVVFMAPKRSAAISLLTFNSQHIERLFADGRKQGRKLMKIL